jgi:hypothetical protein
MVAGGPAIVTATILGLKGKRGRARDVSKVRPDVNTGFMLGLCR